MQSFSKNEQTGADRTYCIPLNTPLHTHTHTIFKLISTKINSLCMTAEIVLDEYRRFLLISEKSGKFFYEGFDIHGRLFAEKRLIFLRVNVILY